MRVVIGKNKDKFLKRGYPWIFANQIERVDGGPKSGDVVEVAGPDGVVHGLGLFHESSQITLRFLTSNPTRTIDASFFRERLRRALLLRQTVFKEATHYRLAFSESDGLPGTIIDRYGDTLTWSSLSLGMELRREWLLDALEELLSPTAIVERNESQLREKDGLPISNGVLRGSYESPVEVREEDASFLVDVLHGPKTGSFLDQRLNRIETRRFVAGKRVLDVFSADGGFGLHAARAGASSVHLLDSSSQALERAVANAERNGVRDRITTEEADALDRLGEMADAGESYDVVILDPPAFAKSRRQVEQALKAYQRINISALRMLRPGGVLATASCSQAVSESDFVKVLEYSVRRIGSRVRILHRGYQPPDHPVLPSMPETHYLKFYVMEKLDDELPGVSPRT